MTRTTMIKKNDGVKVRELGLFDKVKSYHYETRIKKVNFSILQIRMRDSDVDTARGINYVSSVRPKYCFCAPAHIRYAASNLSTVETIYLEERFA